MTRHARNNTAGAVYSYHERQRDTKSSGYGTQRQRLAKESIKDFDACNLTLQSCRHPVITPEGFLYDKESIFEFIVHQKRENARKLKNFEKQKTREELDLKEINKNNDIIKTQLFLKTETGLVNKALKPSTSSMSTITTTKPNTSAETSAETSGAVGSGISNMSSGRDKDLPSFWIPSMTPQSKKTKLKKPETTIYCPMSGKPLKINKLIDVHFTPTNDSKGKYKCAVTHDLISNSVPCAVLKTSGTVVTMECIQKLIRKDMLDPINGQKLTEEDIIPLQRGGTGYAAANDLEAAVKRPVMMA